MGRGAVDGAGQERGGRGERRTERASIKKTWHTHCLSAQKLIALPLLWAIMAASLNASLRVCQSGGGARDGRRSAEGASQLGGQRSRGRLPFGAITRASAADGPGERGTCARRPRKTPHTRAPGPPRRSSRQRSGHFMAGGGGGNRSRRARPWPLDDSLHVARMSAMLPCTIGTSPSLRNHGSAPAQ